MSNLEEKEVSQLKANTYYVGDNIVLLKKCINIIKKSINQIENKI